MQKLLINIRHASIYYQRLWLYAQCMLLKTCHLIICKCTCVGMCVAYVCMCMCTYLHVVCVTLCVCACLIRDTLQGESLCSDKNELPIESCSRLYQSSSAGSKGVSEDSVAQI